jgi:phage gp36-like protein
MSYATLQDLIDRFGEQRLIELTDPDAQFIVDDKIDRALADAEGDIDTHLELRYALPLPTVPTALTRIACDLARYYLYGDAAPELVVKRYDAAMRFLRSLADGTVQLGVPDGTAPAADFAEVQGGGNVWDRSDDGFI